MISPVIRRVRSAAHLRGGFSLVELLVVMAVIALLIAMLLPALQKAQGAALRIHCQSNQRQMFLAALSYAHDWDSIFPTHGSGNIPRTYGNRFSRGPHIRDEYAGGNMVIWHCPVARPYYTTPTWGQATGLVTRSDGTNYSFAHGQFGYLYFGGWGSSETRTNYIAYHGWYSQITRFDARGRRVMPTYSLKEAEQLGNAADRPLFMDINKLNGEAHMGGGNDFRTYPNPAHGPALGALSGTDENIVFVDGHSEGIFDPLVNFRYSAGGYFRW